MIRAPYKLFDCYTLKDQDLFFGREEEVLRTVGEILSTRLLVLFAPSGSGKSSLINAGICPVLNGRGLDTVCVRLESDPIASIKRKLWEELKLPGFDSLNADADLCDALEKTYLPADGQTVRQSLVIFLDQFEEFFIVFRKDPEERRKFISQVAKIKFNTRLPVYLVFSLRDDYFVHLNEFRDEIPSIFQNNSNIQLCPLDDQAALRCITKPAAVVGLDYEKGLPERIVADLKQRNVSDRHLVNLGGQGILPVTLQIVCHSLSLKKPEQDTVFSLALYEQLGGATKIIDDHFYGSLRQIPRRQHKLMQRCFEELITPDFTKRLRSLTDLEAILRVRDKESLASLLRQLTDANVLREERANELLWYEFRHDYLVPQVCKWLEDFKRQQTQRQRAYTYAFLAVVLPASILATLAVVSFMSFEVRFSPRESSDMQQEVCITRRFNPFGLRITTGVLRGELRDQWAQDQVAAGFPLPFGRLKCWDAMTNLMDELPAQLVDLQALAHHLDDPDPLVRVRTARVLLELGKPEAGVFSVLESAVHDRDPAIQMAAASALRQLPKPVPRVLRPVVNALKYADPVGEQVKGTLVQWAKEDRSVVPLLITELTSDTSSVGAQVVETLRRVGDGEPAVIQALVVALGRGDVNVRINAAAALGDLGKPEPAVLAGLVAALQQKGVCVKAAAALGHLGKAELFVIRALAAGLKSDDASLREAAAVALGELGNADAEPTVFESLASALEYQLKSDLYFFYEPEDSKAKVAAAAALKKLGKPAPVAIKALVAALGDKNASVRAESASALADLGKSSPVVVQSLVDALTNSVAEARAGAAFALGKSGRPEVGAVQKLMPLLQDSNTVVRSSVAASIGRLAKAEPKAVDALLVTLHDPDVAVRGSAAAALGDLGNGGVTVVEALVTTLRDKNAEVRASASTALGQLGKVLPLVVSNLVSVAGNSDPNVRAGAVAALGQAGNPEPEVLKGLIISLQDSDVGVRALAATALGQLGKAEPTVVTALMAALKVDYPASAPYYSRVINPKPAVLWALGQLPSAGPPVVDAVVNALKDKDSDVRSAAAAALLQLGSSNSAVVYLLVPMLKHNDIAVRTNAASVLGQLGQTRADWSDERLVRMLQDNESGWRKTAGFVLAYRRNLDARTIKEVKVLQRDNRPWVRMASWHALEQIRRLHP